jgi:hypothetical protein
LRVTSRNAEIVDLNACRAKRTGVRVPGDATEIISVQRQMTSWPVTMAISFAVWPAWAFWSFFVSIEDENRFGAA